MWSYSIFNWRKRVKRRGLLWRSGQVWRKWYPGITHQPIYLLQSLSFPHNIWPGPGGHSVWQCHLQSAPAGKVFIATPGSWPSYKLHCFLTFDNDSGNIPCTYNLNVFPQHLFVSFLITYRERRKLYENSRLALWENRGLGNSSQISLMSLFISAFQK